MIVYHVSLDSVSLQTLDVKIDIPALTDSIVLTLPAWIPGSYMIRDFARNIGEFNAVDNEGHHLQWEKTDKQTWKLQTNKRPCKVSYKVVANDYSVRGAFVNDEYAFFNGTSAFLNIEQAGSNRFKVKINSESAPREWDIYSSMPESCDSYLALVDHPVFWGKAQTKSFNVDGIEFTMLLSGNQPVDIEKICDDLKPVCLHHLNLFGAPHPISKYLFITLLAEKGFGGLEHRDSTVLMYPRFDLPMAGETDNKSDTYIDFLSLCSHELFHTWHVKRIRPQVLLQPNLSTEVYTPQLWIYEGFTSFYDDVAVARAGQMSPEHYCTILGRHITRLMHTPGRHKQSVTESSFDAWTRFYKQDANSNNHIVSYYTKGGIIALGLDILLREHSDGRVSLDTVMQQLWQTCGIEETGTEDNQIEQICEQFNVDVTDYLNDVVYGTHDVDLAGLLPKIGLTLEHRARTHSKDRGGNKAENPGSHDFGMTVSDAKGTGCKVTQLQESGAGTMAGLMIGDIIIAADNWLMTESLWQRLINQAQENATLALTVAREGRLIQLEMPVIPAIERVAYLDITDNAKFLNWLGIAETSS